MKRYSFEALNSVREHKVVERQQQLAVRLSEAETAKILLREAEDSLRQQQERLEEEQLREMRRANAGVARAGDFQNAEPFRVLCKAQLAAAEERRVNAERALREAMAAQTSCERQLAEARADAKLLERHREQFEIRRRTRQEHSDEELALEAWAASGENH